MTAVADASAGTDELLTANKLEEASFGGSTGAGTAVKLSHTGTTAGFASPLDLLNRMARIMDTNNVDTENRWFVADPVFFEKLMAESSKFVSADFNLSMGDGGVIRNGRVGDGLIRGFRIYMSNNLPFLGTGAGTTPSDTASASNFGVVIAGHSSAAATAQQIDKTETYRDPDSFSDIVRGMQLYGRKILRPESIVTARYQLAATI